MLTTLRADDSEYVISRDEMMVGSQDRTLVISGEGEPDDLRLVDVMLYLPEGQTSLHKQRVGQLMLLGSSILDVGTNDFARWVADPARSRTPLRGRGWNVKRSMLTADGQLQDFTFERVPR